MKRICGVITSSLVNSSSHAAPVLSTATMEIQKTVLSVVGNPRPASRTHAIATTLSAAIADQLGGVVADPIDLAAYGPRVLDYEDQQVAADAKRVLQADVLVVASPTYKATYSGLLKAFLDRIGGGALGGTPAVAVLLGGAPNHSMAVSAHFAPLLVELGAVVPGGLFVLESDVEAFPSFAAGWVAERRALLAGAVASHRAAVAAAATAESDSAGS